MSNVDFRNVNFYRIKGYCLSKKVDTDVIKDVYEYRNLEFNFIWEEGVRTCMVCLSDCEEVEK